uniref:Zonadhesin, like n=1 Tax=Myripristis murdjan TaxID=586833 RepID=A0A668A5K6_9TELE
MSKENSTTILFFLSIPPYWSLLSFHAIVLTSCDFNQDSEPFCKFTQDTADNSDWIRHKGPTPTPGTGPSGDYPDGKGYYIYHECDNVVNGQSARLISPAISSSNTQICVQFRYYMYGSDNQNKLRVLARRPGNDEEVWSKTGIQSPSWLKGSVTVSKPADQAISVTFNILSTACVTGCDFDTFDNLCGWTTPPTGNPNVLGFSQWNGPTDTEGTGPEDDFSKPGFGFYMLLDSIEAVPGFKAEIRSPTVTSSGCLELTFYYYMYGTATTMELSVHTVTAGRTFSVSSYFCKCYFYVFIRFCLMSISTLFLAQPTTPVPPITTPGPTTPKPPTPGPTTPKPPTPGPTTPKPPTPGPTTPKPPTPGPTTPKPPTPGPTTPKPPTPGPTTPKPPTPGPTTPKPPTPGPTTPKPPTPGPTTPKPPTPGPTTPKPPTPGPTTPKPPTPGPTTPKPPTPGPTTPKPPTPGPTTPKPPTPGPTTPKPPTPGPTTPKPPTPGPTTPKPPTPGPTTPKPPTPGPTTPKPPTPGPTTPKPPTPGPTTPKPPTPGPTTPKPPTPGPTTPKPPTPGPTTPKPPTPGPTTPKPSTPGPTTPKPPTPGPTTPKPPTPGPTTPKPPTPGPTTPKPPTPGPTTPKPPTPGPTTPKPSTPGPTTPKPPTPGPTTPKPTTPRPTTKLTICGPACIPSCMEPFFNCTGSCIDGCFCKPGYVFKGRRCVPLEKCGCLDDQNNYYEPGEIIFGDGCSKMCRCAGNYTLECVDNSCSPTEECREVSGVSGCYPKGTSTCIASGDPHYTTFDKRKYDFMGNCSYVMSEPCNDTTLPHFEVHGKNEERGVSGVSYLKKLYVTVDGVTVTLMKSRRTLVNGRRVALPHSPSPLISLSLAGQYVTLQTTFGLRVRWDGNHYAQISVPSSYHDQMCGLCGDYDGNPSNDFTKPDGTLVGNTNDFGNSWQTEEDEDDSCTPGTKPDPDCDPKLEAEVVKPDKCGKIKDPAGPFRECISVVDPTPFFQSCVYDMCQFSGQQRVLCDQLQAYTDACLSAGAKVHQWRTPDFCPLACPPNSSYSMCVSSCPETCLGVVGPPGCQDVCVEGCQCNPGFILSNDKCVPLKDCGCVDPSGSYHPAGENWYVEGCEQKCVCQGGGLIQCHNTSCAPATESCQLQDGEYGCHPLGTGICSVSGDPHYTTFDKTTHHYMGACSYTLTKPCNETSGLPYFTVDTQNEHRGSNKKVSYVKAVVINVNGMTIILGKGRKVQVNGTAVVPPLTLTNGVKIYLSGKFVVLETAFGLRVRFDGNHHADVTLPTSYSGLLCGLCGNFNGQSKDDNIKPDGKPAFQSLGEARWSPLHCPAHLHSSFCLSSGVFKECHAVVPPGPYFSNCIYDLCATGGQTVALCQAIESYADLCAAAGVPIAWRNNTFCPLKCPPGSNYTHCGPACPQPSCQEPAGPSGSCNKPCVEGCVCNEGLILSGDKCVPPSECGCTDEDGKYRPVSAGENWYVEGCEQKCVCQGGGLIQCHNTSCAPATENMTSLLNTSLRCRPAGTGICSVSGDPHYTTFDKTTHHYMGACSYTLTKPCNETSGLPYFTVDTQNEHRGTESAPLTLCIDDQLTCAVVSSLQVNGTAVVPPLTLTNGVKIYLSGKFVVLETAFGLRVRFDGNHHADVTLPTSYITFASPPLQVCGMCGNYNHDSSDDNLMPNKKPAKDVIELGNSWKSEGDSDPGSVGFPIPHGFLCLCVILSDRFKPCHSVVPPEAFLGNCIYDMCEYDGMQATLCDNVEAYAQACQSAGVTISWRNSTFCPLPCPPNSHYSDCTAPCPPTCSDLFPIFCHLPPTACVEGCQCDAGFVLSDGKCVPLSKCGCVSSDGEYHDVGDSWLTDKCTEQCTCDLGGKITCKDHHCKSNSVCDLDKYGDQFDKCSISGDPHYRTFDGFTHHYQGPYTYILTQGHNLQGSLPSLKVRGKNIRRGGNRRVSFLDQMYIDVYGINVRFLQRKTGGLSNVVNGERVAPPLSPVDGLSITMNSRQVQLTTDFGLTVRFDGNKIVLPNTYKNSVRGLCGNYDGITRNEYMKPDGTVTRNLNEFGDSWRDSDRLADIMLLCFSQCPPQARGCSQSQLNNYNGVTQCGALSDPKGPFASCHSTLPPKVLLFFLPLLFTHLVSSLLGLFSRSVLQLNEKFVTEDCSESCECTTTGAVCQPKTCQSGFVCTVYNFKRDCYRGGGAAGDEPQLHEGKYSHFNPLEPAQTHLISFKTMGKKENCTKKAFNQMNKQDNRMNPPVLALFICVNYLV